MTEMRYTILHPTRPLFWVAFPKQLKDRMNSWPILILGGSLGTSQQLRKIFSWTSSLIKRLGVRVHSEVSSKVDIAISETSSRTHRGTP